MAAFIPDPMVLLHPTVFPHCKEQSIALESVLEGDGDVESRARQEVVPPAREHDRSESVLEGDGDVESRARQEVGPPAREHDRSETPSSVSDLALLVERLQASAAAAREPLFAMGNLHIAVDKVTEFFGLAPAWPDPDLGGDQSAANKMLPECPARDVSQADREGILSGLMASVWDATAGLADATTHTDGEKGESGSEEEEDDEIVLAARRLRMRTMAAYTLLSWAGGRNKLTDGVKAPSLPEVKGVFVHMETIYRRRALFQEFRRGGRVEEWNPTEEAAIWEEFGREMREFAHDAVGDDFLRVIGGGNLQAGHDRSLNLLFLALGVEAAREEERRDSALASMISAEEAYADRWLPADTDPAETHQRCAAMGVVLGHLEPVRAWVAPMTKAARFNA
jgi:hypothetical protein